MIRTFYGLDGNSKMRLRWFCDVCSHQSRSLEPRDGIESIVEHLAEKHSGQELRDFAGLMVQGMSSAAKLVHPEDNPDAVDSIAQNMVDYITDGDASVLA